MAALAMHLVLPADGTRLIGSGAQRLTAALDDAAPVPLFYKWYSSLAADPLGTALDVPAAALPLGSQIVTFTAKDQLADTAEALQAVVHAGMAGGPPAGGLPCRVHVLIADLREPAAGATLARVGATLAARAPSRWWPEPAAPGPDPEDHTPNKLRYRWRFAPSGAPAGRAGGDLPAAGRQLVYVAPGDDGGGKPAVPLLRYAGPLPAGLGTGAYTLTLRVEHADDAAQGHEQSIAVVLA